MCVCVCGRNSQHHLSSITSLLLLASGSTLWSLALILIELHAFLLLLKNKPSFRQVRDCSIQSVRHGITGFCPASTCPATHCVHVFGIEMVDKNTYLLVGNSELVELLLYRHDNVVV